MNYEVLITGYCSVLVIDAEDEHEAIQFARDAMSFGDFQHDDSMVHKVVPDHELENARKHADVIAEDA